MEKNVFINRRKRYKFVGLFDSDKTKVELDEILHSLGFYMFKYMEVDKPTNTLKKGRNGRPLKYSEELMKSVINRERSDEEFGVEIKRSANTVRNMRLRWIEKYPHLLKNIKEKVE